jgi:hypothetical protein
MLEMFVEILKDIHENQTKFSEDLADTNRLFGQMLEEMNVDETKISRWSTEVNLEHENNDGGTVSPTEEGSMPEAEDKAAHGTTEQLSSDEIVDSPAEEKASEKPTKHLCLIIRDFHRWSKRAKPRWSLLSRATSFRRTQTGTLPTEGIS